MYSGAGLMPHADCGRWPLKCATPAPRIEIDATNPVSQAYSLITRSCYESIVTSPDTRGARCLRRESYRAVSAVECARESFDSAIREGQRSEKSFGDWPAGPELRVRHCADGAKWVWYRRFCERRGEVRW